MPQRPTLRSRLRRAWCDSRWESSPRQTSSPISSKRSCAPPRTRRHVRLGAVVFVAGAATLAVEISASRLLAPFFGSSTIVWANVIGLILVYLSLGYWLGGRVADRRPERALLGRIIVVAALAIAVIPFVARPFLDATLKDLNAASPGPAAAPVLAGRV